MELKPDSKPPEFHRVSGGSSTLHGQSPDLSHRGSSTLLCRSPDRLCFWCRPPDQESSTLPGRPPDRESSTLLSQSRRLCRPPSLRLHRHRRPSPAIAGHHGLYASAGLLVFAFAVVTSLHGLYVSFSLHVFAASLDAFAGNCPGLCVAGPRARLNYVPVRDNLQNFVPAQGDILVGRLTFVPARYGLLVARLNFVPARDSLLVTRLNFVFLFLGQK
ncbi:hypothetical protein ILYODFUR_013232 [Ilyodon furcidens]|uniref:Seipin n=1 Tax=Ilyodon furcidens TaxID=33524 RepID=A0ABV0V2P2_9TELE